VAHIENLFAEESKAKWFDESKRCAMSEFCQLMFFVRPVSLLSKPLSDYLVDWQRFAHVREIIRHLGAVPSQESWQYLIELGRASAAKDRPPEGLTIALSAALSTNHFMDFLNILTDGTWFSWCHSAWNLKHIAPDIIRVIGNDADSLDSFLGACDRSGSPFADEFACAVLALFPDGETTRLRYGLVALDTGKVVDSSSSVYSMLKEMFTFHVPLSGDGHYEVHPKACNDLRRHLYNRARGDGIVATTSRRLLASIECQRQEGGRPTDEPRHPAAEDGVAWTEVLVLSR